MYSGIYYLHALSALHAGTGQGAGVIDLPIAREKSTHLPVVPGSSVKGVLREELDDRAEKPTRAQHRALFGPKNENAADHAGALAFGDARLLCLPVRSLAGTFAWTTCPLVLRRYARDLQDIDASIQQIEIPVPQETQVKIYQGSVLKSDSNRVFLEDLDLLAMEDNASNQSWADRIGRALFPDSDWLNLFQQRFAIVSDEVFDFLAETATEIVTRIRLEENTRTVAKGGLWFEEHLPAESILWGIVGCDRSRYGEVKQSGSELMGLLPAEERIQIGGNASVGKGQARWILQGN